MSQILIAGASGLIGTALVRQLDPAHSLTLLCRKAGAPQPRHHWLPADFEQLADLDLPSPVDIAFCCLGTTRKQAGSDDAFRRVDHDYVLALPSSLAVTAVNVSSSSRVWEPTHAHRPSIPAPRGRWNRPCWHNPGNGLP